MSWTRDWVESWRIPAGNEGNVGWMENELAGERVPVDRVQE